MSETRYICDLSFTTHGSFGSVVIRNEYLLSSTHDLIRVGLPPIDPFTNGWLVAGVPLYMAVRKQNTHTRRELIV